MQVVQKTVDDLIEFANKVNDVTVLVMDEQGVEKALAHVYGIISHYSNKRESPQGVLDVLNSSYRILDTFVRNQVSSDLPVTKKAVKIFDEIVKTLLALLARDFGIIQSRYDEALETRMNLRAIKACGINPPGHHNSFSGIWSKNKGDIDEEALKHASENVIAFTNFVFRIARNNEYVQDPFTIHPISDALSIYQKLKSLTPIIAPLTHNQ